MQGFYTSVPEEFLKRAADNIVKYSDIDPEYYNNANVKRGLRNADGTGVLADFTRIGNVHGYIIDEGDKIAIPGKLIYRGIDVEEIVDGCIKDDRFGFEEVAYLLLFGKLPSFSELEEFTDILGRLRELPENFTEDMIIKAPSPNVMNKLSRSVLALYSYDDNPDDISVTNVMHQCLQLIARFPTIVAYAYQVKKHYYDHESLVLHFPKEKLSSAENFLRTIRPDGKFSDEDAKLLDLALILHAEHGGGNNSAFACRVLSSAGTDTYAAMAAAIGSLKGPKHGGANIKAAEMLADIAKNVSDWKDEDEIKAYLKKIIIKEAGDGAGLIYGMGHAIYTVSDPRAVLLKSFARPVARRYGREDYLDLIENVENCTQQVFNESSHSGKMLCANVDLYSGFIYDLLGIPHELYTPIFAISRIVGWSAHRLEEIINSRRIIRPAYKAVSPACNYTSIYDRK